MKTLTILLTAILFHTQLALAAGCDLPRFGGAQLTAAADNSTFMASGDFNQDGFIDVVLGGAYTNAAGRPATGLSVLLGNGDGTFQPAVYYAVDSPNDVVVADFNGDGKPDLAVVYSLGIQVMLGNGDGTFKAGLRTAVTTTSLAVGDFNGDGKMDLAASDVFRILLGKGDGTFQPAVSPAGSDVTYGRVAVGDFNGDGKLDAAGVTVAGVLVVMLGDGKGSVGAPARVNTGLTSFGRLAVADLNGDQKLDVVIFGSTDKKILTLLGNGAGGFQAPTAYATGGALASGFLVADINGDGVPDVAVTQLMSFTDSGSTISVFAGNGDGTLRPAVPYNPIAQLVIAMAVGDFNSDGLADLVFTSSAKIPTQLGVMFGAADGTLQTALSYAAGPGPASPVLADFNGDGALDLVVADTGPGGSISVLLGNGDGSFQAAVNYPAAAGAKGVGVGDFNGDGKPDLLVSVFATTGFSVQLFPGNGDGSFGAPVTGSAFNAGNVVVGDFNKDGKMDAVVSGQVLLGNGDGSFRSTVNFVAAFVAAADFNGDGNLDMVGFGTSSVLVQLGNGDGTFRTQVRYPTGSSAASLAVGDLNGDGKLDLVAIADPFIRGAANQVLSGTVAVLLGNGDGTFQPAVKYTVAQGLTYLALGDFNGDGAMDLAVSNLLTPTGAVTVLLGVGDGTFRSAQTYAGGSAPASMVVGDLNGDGKPDLAIFDSFTNNVEVMLNTYVPGSSGSVCTAVPAVGI